MPPKPKPKGLSSWSFSRYSDYKLCPLKAKLKHIDKVPEPANDAMERGNKVHKAAEGYLRGTTRKLAPELKTFKRLMDDLRKQFKKRPGSMVVEDTWAFDKVWERSQWNNWEECVVRIKVDCGHLTGPTEMTILDWKTGKYRQERNDEYMEQLELYALAALLLNPQVQKVSCKLVYVDLGMLYPPEGDDSATFDRKDLKKLKAAWDKRTRKMLLDRAFAPRPNDKCTWCHYGQSGRRNGGPGLCKY